MKVDLIVGLGTEQGGRHDRTLQMPTGVACAPGAVPLHGVRCIRLPKHEIGRVALDLLRGHVHASTLSTAKRIKRVARQLTIVREGVDTEVDDAVGGDVRVILFDEPLDELDHLIDVLGGTRQQLRLGVGVGHHFHAQTSCVLDEGIGVEVRDGPRIAGVNVDSVRQCPGFLGFKQSARCHFHLVFATTIGVGVIGHVTDIGDVHHVPNVMPEQLQRASKHIGVEEGPEVSDVGVVVDRGPAGIEQHPTTGGVDGHEFLLGSRQRVVEVKWHGLYRRQFTRSGRRSAHSGPSDRRFQRHGPQLEMTSSRSMTSISPSVLTSSRQSSSSTPSSR